MAKETTTQLPLPYPEIGKVATRAQMRDVGIQGDQTFHIDVAIVRIREGFNIRTKPVWMTDEEWHKELDIESLALDIAKNGMIEPLLGDLAVLPDETLVFYLTDGYRRYLAVLWLLENCHTTQKNGKAMNVVEVRRFALGTTDKQRELYMLASGKKKAYNEMQMARGLKRLKDLHKMSNQEIADQLGYSRQWVDNKINLTTLTQEQQDAIERGELKATNALGKKPKEKLHLGNGLSEDQKKQLSDDFNKPLGNQSEDGKDSIKFIPGGFETLSQTPNNQTEEIVVSQPTKVITETKASLDAEMQSRQTDGKFKEHRPKNDQKDALAKIDFTKDKTEAEMELNEVKGMLDKITNYTDHFPSHMKHLQKDIQGLCAASIRKIDGVQTIIKKAADER